MGFADREYYREPSQPGHTLRAPQSMVKILLIINAVLFFANYLFTGATNDITAQFVVSPDVLLKPWLWWKFVTSGFAHADLQHILFNMFALWMFGRDVESVYGPKEFLRIYLAALLLGTFGWTLKQFFFFGPQPESNLLGASGAVTAVLLLFCIHFPRRTLLLMMVFPVPAWVFGVMIVLLNLFQTSSFSNEQQSIAYDVHLIGAAFAICYWKFRWNLGRWTPRSFALNTALGNLRRRPKLKVHTPDHDHQKQNVEADRILDKLHREGEASLTQRERRTLEDYSRRMQQKHR